MIQIDHDVPIPHLTTRGKMKYPLAQMKPGDSFFIAGKNPKTLCTYFQRWRRKYGNNFCSRTTCENGVSGVRVWCISDAEVQP